MEGVRIWWILGGLILLGLLPLLGLIARHRTRGGLVLWCRRFSIPNEEVGKRNRWLWAVIAEACRGEAIPVTLRDRSFAGAQSVGRSVQNPLATILIFVGTPLWLWGMLTVLDWVEGSFPEFLVCAVGLASYIGMFILIGRITVFTTKRLATYQGDPKKTGRTARGNSKETLEPTGDGGDSMH